MDRKAQPGQFPPFLDGCLSRPKAAVLEAVMVLLVNIAAS
jgi:hypothetical protein